jgi:hypothetical protein
MEDVLSALKPVDINRLCLHEEHGIARFVYTRIKSIFVKHRKNTEKEFLDKISHRFYYNTCQQTMIIIFNGKVIIFLELL